jgi:hypothetical protein
MTQPDMQVLARRLTAALGHALQPGEQLVSSIPGTLCLNGQQRAPHRPDDLILIGPYENQDAELLAALVLAASETTESRLDRIREAYNVRALTLTFRDDQWTAEIEHDRVTFTGTGDTADVALVEAIVSRNIGDFYYGSLDAQLTPEQMNTWWRDTHLAALGILPDTPYAGEYAQKDTP